VKNPQNLYQIIDISNFKEFSQQNDNNVHENVSVEEIVEEEVIKPTKETSNSPT
jgi:hypothetical protein